MRLAKGALGLACASSIAVACGARTGLVSPPIPNRSNQFCVNASFDAGFSDLDLVVLLDRSGSMLDAGKWNDATAALVSFVGDPAENGLGVALAFVPPVWGDACAPETYAQPVVPMELLPGASPKIQSALSDATPTTGSTPLAEALTGAVEYARGVRLADPTRQVAVAIITDGAPEGCANAVDAEAVHAVVAVAAQAFGSEPSVMTFIVGLSIGDVAPMNEMAAAGGTTAAILIDASPSAAQNIVDALSSVRDGLSKCRFPIPPVGDAKLTTGDLAISYRLSPGDASVPLSLYSSAGACGAADGFIVDDANAPTRVQLCPSTCATVHAHAGSTVAITAGCGLGAPDGGAHDAGDGGACPNQFDVHCIDSCVSQTYVAPVCAFGDWTCPPGSVDDTSCNCPPVPHGCCISDGTWTDASCVNAKWVCPAGAKSFGDAGCAPPAECAPLLPCGPNAFCKSPDFSCGSSHALGSCASEPLTCPPGAPACGCDSTLYASDCNAAVQGVNLGDATSCTAPPNTFGCGPYFCRDADEVCKKTIDLAKTIGSVSWACIPKGACPTGCNCNQCLPCPAGHSKCNEVCTTDGNGDAFLTCSELP